MISKDALIDRTLLEALSQADPYMMTEENLFNVLVITFTPTPTRTKCSERLKWLEAHHFIVRLATESSGIKQKLTDEGKAALLS